MKEEENVYPNVNKKETEKGRNKEIYRILYTLHGTNR